MDRTALVENSFKVLFQLTPSETETYQRQISLLVSRFRGWCNIEHWQTPLAILKEIDKCLPVLASFFATDHVSIIWSVDALSDPRKAFLRGQGKGAKLEQTFLHMLCILSHAAIYHRNFPECDTALDLFWERLERGHQSEGKIPDYADKFGLSRDLLRTGLARGRRFHYFRARRQGLALLFCAAITLLDNVDYKYFPIIADLLDWGCYPNIAALATQLSSDEEYYMTTYNSHISRSSSSTP
jgi:hypothetical protein